MKLSKFIIPISIALAGFLYGYNGARWLGRMPPKDMTGSQTVGRDAELSGSKVIKPQSDPTKVIMGEGRKKNEGVAVIEPSNAKELHIVTPDADEDYDTVEEGQNEEEVGEGEGEDAESDLEEDQAGDQSFPQDEPGADSLENEEVDLDSNAGDLEEDETADTADDKPVTP